MSTVQTELNAIVKEIRFLAKECDARIKCVVTMENVEYKCIAEADNGGLQLSIAGYGSSMEAALLSAAKHLKSLMVQMMVDNDLLRKVFSETSDEQKEKCK